MAQLKIIRGREVGRTAPVDGEVFLGRDEGNDLRLLDETSSRRHAKVQRLEDRCVLYDLDSNNGTWVNGERVRERLLKDGDQIVIGRTTLVFEDDGVRRAVTVTLGAEDDVVQVEGALASDAALEPSSDLARLRKLYDIAALLSATLEPRAMGAGLATILLDALDADAAVVVLPDEETIARAREASLEVDVSRAVLDRARRERQALLVASAPDDRDLGSRPTIARARIQSMLCAPLLRGDRWFGALYADVRRTGRKFQPADLAFVTAAAQHAALAFENAQKLSAAQARVTELSAQVSPRARLAGEDPRFVEAVRLAERAAQADSTVLVLGESGTGKELFARLVHERSRRSAGPFVPINCAALAETLLESEMFGHERGAFTGAAKMQPGKVETADGGTLFLDEIGELSSSVQAKLLRFLQERAFFRVGGTKPRSVDVRIVAATNRDLAGAIKSGAFREDLFYRLSVVTLRLPALRDRKVDVPTLARALLERVRERVKKPVRDFTPAAIDALVAYSWPGNVRELENVIERSAILADGPKIDVALLPAEVRNPSPAGPAGEAPLNLDAMEKLCIERALARTGGRKGDAAQLLGISWPTLNKKIRDYGIPEPN